MTHGGVAAILDDDGRFKRIPRMAIEIAAHHFAVLGPLVVGVNGAVRADEAFAIFLDEGDEGGFLFVVKVKLAGGHEEDGVEVIEVLRVAGELLLGGELGVRLDVGVPIAGVVAEAQNVGHAFGGGVVLEAFGLANAENFLAFGRRRSLRVEAGGGELSEERGGGLSAGHVRHHINLPLSAYRHVLRVGPRVAGCVPVQSPSTTTD